jgi:hypothetical protein
LKGLVRYFVHQSKQLSLTPFSTLKPSVTRAKAGAARYGYLSATKKIVV